MSSGAELLRLRDVSFAYGAGRFSLEVQDLQLEDGEQVACMGPSGSGKTTLLELMAGLLDPSKGTVEFQGQAWGRCSKSERQAQRLAHMGLVFQGFELLSALNVEENILMPLRFLGRPTGPAQDRAHSMMERLGILELAGQRPAHLSFGERQRAAICRALITDPKVILADEPTANLDGASATLALDLLLEYGRTRGAGLFLITHDGRHVEAMDRVVQMESLAGSATR